MVMSITVLFVFAVMGVGWATILILNKLDGIRREIHDVNSALVSVHGRLVEIREGTTFREERDREG